MKAIPIGLKANTCEKYPIDEHAEFAVCECYSEGAELQRDGEVKQCETATQLAG
jgi:hypothetical protein